MVGDHLSRPKLLRHAAFIKRHADESYIPLHQDIALWEKAYESAVTFWIALTPSRNENGGMFYCRSAETIYPHEFNLQYPMFKCIDVEKIAFRRKASSMRRWRRVMFWSGRRARRTAVI
ncbi:hypothetical protein GGER_21670 [Serratia rubidaea]